VARRAGAITVGIWSGLGALAIASACTSFESADATSAPDAAEAGAADTGVDVAAEGPSSPCVGAEHFLCADFNAPPYTKGWTEEGISDGGTLELDPSTSVSPPSSLRASVREQDVGAGAGLTKRLIVKPHELTLSFALRVDETTNAGAAVAAIELGTTEGAEGVHCVISGTALEAQLSVEVVTYGDGGIQRDLRVVPVPIPTREWHAVTLVLSLPGGGDSGTLKLVLDGTTRLDGPVTLRSSTPGARVEMGLGHYSNRYPAHQVHIDDVVVDVTPAP
jgi:hypothetical protein